MVGGVAGEDVGEAGLDAHADEREQTAFDPPVVRVELLLAEEDARAGERHRHVEVGAARVERRREDLRIEARVGRVQDGVGVRPPEQLGDRAGGRGVDLRGREALVGQALDERRRPRRVEVGERHLLEEIAPPGDRRHRRADASGAHDDDSHCESVTRR